MHLLWIIRGGLVIILFALIFISGYFLKNRKKYEKLMENTIANILLVITYNILCYSIVGIPHDTNFIQVPLFLKNPFVVSWYNYSGIILFAVGLFFMIITVLKRKVLGGQDTKGKLLTEGIYSFCRHPIYLGIVLVSLSIPLKFINIDGILCFPFILTANLIEAKFEENFDLKIRFKEEYSLYKKRTKIFGPLWLWIILLIILLLPLIISIIK
ncbi:MAG: DUF1295 domain-containing protein [Spirochaetes bacterium]|nr:DUF1295 domain-containing protein [Spirochaetota bacterium]